MMQNNSKPMRHGILVLHGAGMPEDNRNKLGDTLATITDGLIDVFNQDLFLSKHYEIATSATVAHENLTDLHLNIFRKDKDRRGELEHQIHVREVFWKPVMPKRGLSEYIPLLWLSAFAFHSHVLRKDELQIRDRRGPADWDKEGLEDMDKDLERARRRQDFMLRVVVAVFGVLSTLLWVSALEALHRFGNFSLIASPSDPRWGQIGIAIISLSIVAALLLVCFAGEEKWFRDKKRPMPNLYLGIMIAATAWLALFLVPVLLLLYYIDRVLTLALVLVVAWAAAQVAFNLSTWELRFGFLLLLALVAFLVLNLSQSSWAATISGKVAGRIREDMQKFFAEWLTTLLVVAGAPWIIMVIGVLELLGRLPVGGDSFKKLAQTLSELGYWQALKDIHMFLTDSGRSAEVCYRVEQELLNLCDTDSLHILAHSLGTVVAYDALVNLGRGDGALIGRQPNDPVYGKLKTLVTYGSPLNKLRQLAQHAAKVPDLIAGFDYTRFAPEARLERSFSDLATPPGSTNPKAADPFCWVNFYALQDVISDACSLYSTKADVTRPHEFSAWTAKDILSAHGSYWTDPGFWNTTLQAMNVIYEKGELCRIEKLSRDKVKDGLIEALRGQGIVTQEQVAVRLKNLDDRQDLLKQLGRPFTMHDLETLFELCQPAPEDEAENREPVRLAA